MLGVVSDACQLSSKGHPSNNYIRIKGFSEMSTAETTVLIDWLTGQSSYNHYN